MSCISEQAFMLVESLTEFNVISVINNFIPYFEVGIPKPPCQISGIICLICGTWPYNYRVICLNRTGMMGPGTVPKLEPCRPKSALPINHIT